jgi:hypothetical protein
VAEVDVLKVDSGLAVDHMSAWDEHFAELFIHSDHTEHAVVGGTIFLLELVQLPFESLFTPHSSLKGRLKLFVVLLTILVLELHDF